MRELIATACAVTTCCDGCIAFHADAAVKAGATDAEIAEALGVAINLNAGAAVIYSARTLDAVGQARLSINKFHVKRALLPAFYVRNSLSIYRCRFHTRYAFN